MYILKFFVIKFVWKLRKCEVFVGNNIFRMLPNTKNHFLNYFSLQNQTPGFHFSYGNLFPPAFILHLEFNLHRTKRSLIVKVLFFFTPNFIYHLFTFKYTHLIIFKAQEYLCLTIFEKLMIQVHGKTILSMEFKSIIKAHDSNPWGFIHPKPNFHW